MKDSLLYRKWFENVCTPPTNDFLIVISASSRTPVSGTGKTTLGTGLAKTLDRSEGGVAADAQSTLNADESGNTVIPDAPDKAAVIMDDTEGTPGEGSGMIRMRAMKQEVMVAINSVMANRDKTLTIIPICWTIRMMARILSRFAITEVIASMTSCFIARMRFIPLPSPGVP